MILPSFVMGRKRQLDARRDSPSNSRAGPGLALVLVLSLSARIALPQAEVREGFVTTADSVRLYTRIVGDGQETVLVPMASLHSDRLDGLARSRRLVLYDPRGRGRSDRVAPAKVSLEHQLADVETIRRSVGAEQVVLIGWSGLGMEMFVYALRHPGRVSRLVQLAPVPPRQSPYMKAMMDDRWARTDSLAAQELEAQVAAGVYANRQADLCRAINRLSWPATFADPEKAQLAPDVCDLACEWPENLRPYFGALLGSFGEYDWRAAIDSVTVPRLVVHGEQDNIPLDGVREWVTGRGQARLLRVEAAGHWPHYEQPALVLAALDSFLSGHWPAGSSGGP